MVVNCFFSNFLLRFSLSIGFYNLDRAALALDADNITFFVSHVLTCEKSKENVRRILECINNSGMTARSPESPYQIALQYYQFGITSTFE